MVGDDVGLSEDLYVNMIGRYAAAVEVLTKRIGLKDQHIVKLENQLADKAHAVVPENYRVKVDDDSTAGS